jgi:hypothetical protein
MRWRRAIWVVAAGAAASVLLANLMLDGFVLGWRRPVQNWLTAHGLGAYAGHYGLFNLHIPDIILCSVGGLILGYVGQARWLRFAALYAVGYLLAPYAAMLITGSLGLLYPGYGLAVLLRTAAYSFLATVPFVAAGAWLGSKPRYRRRAALRDAGACLACGYDLRGSPGPRCPECGEPI